MRNFYALIAAFFIAAPAYGQMTSPEQVRPILEMTKGNWIAVRLWQGKDLLYFTHLETWRCALTEIRYALNGGPAEVYAFEACAAGQGSPAPITTEGHLPYRVFAPNSIERISIRITYADSVISEAEFTRTEIAIP